jgi:tetratricopeptide (TPR) repeat protein
VQLDNLEQAEADLRQVLAAEPANAAALNALGYTLADRTDRYEEAEQLIRAAFQLDPESPAILDSMGWVAFRQGRLEEAEGFIRQAFIRDRNAEIAAHLGEVLFVMGKQREAANIFNQARRIDPDDPVLLETMERLGFELQ